MWLFFFKVWIRCNVQDITWWIKYKIWVINRLKLIKCWENARKRLKAQEIEFLTAASPCPDGHGSKGGVGPSLNWARDTTGSRLPNALTSEWLFIPIRMVVPKTGCLATQKHACSNPSMSRLDGAGLKCENETFWTHFRRISFPLHDFI